MATKTYVPKSSAKQIETSFGPLIKLSFQTEALKAFLAENTNEKGYINFTISERKEVGQYGDTHSVVLDDWKPSDRGEASPAAKTKALSGAKPTRAKAPDADEADITF
jgi:hypothetical protein